MASISCIGSSSRGFIIWRCIKTIWFEKSIFNSRFDWFRRIYFLIASLSNYFINRKISDRIFCRNELIIGASIHQRIFSRIFIRTIWGYVLNDNKYWLFICISAGNVSINLKRGSSKQTVQVLVISDLLLFFQL